MTSNPYSKGSPCYIAYECGYTDALEDVKEINEHDDRQRHDQMDSGQQGGGSAIPDPAARAER